MSWLGMRVLPSTTVSQEDLCARLESDAHSSQNPIIYTRIAGSEAIIFHKLTPPKSPLLRYNSECERTLEILLKVMLTKTNHILSFI